MEPRCYAWIIPDRLAVAERPGGGGRSNRRERRSAELDWWRSHGVVAIVSAKSSRHGLAEYVEGGFLARWHPIGDVASARAELPALVATVRELLETPGVTAVLVHCDSPGEWLAAIDAALRLGLGLARTRRAALRAAEADGLPVGSIATSIVGRPNSAAA
jgi:hypothetical protein